jgi:hypothetical protein
MTREEGIKLVSRYDGNYDRSLIEKFADYIGITVEGFWSVVDRFANKELFEKISDGNYYPKFKVGVGV